MVIEPDELDKLRTESDRAISVGGFIKSDELDPLYYAGKSYYVLPDGPVGKKAYTLIHRAMEEDSLYGIAQFVLAGRDQLMLHVGSRRGHTTRRRSGSRASSRAKWTRPTTSPTSWR